MAEEIILFGVTPGEFDGDTLCDNIGLNSLSFYAEEILCNLLFLTIFKSFQMLNPIWVYFASGCYFIK